MNQRLSSFRDNAVQSFSTLFKTPNKSVSKLTHQSQPELLILDFLQIFELHHQPPPIIPKTQVKQSFEEQYAIHQKIGQGAHAVVKICVNKASNQKRAVKILRSGDQEIVNTFRKTYELAKGLKHPNIARVQHLYQDQERQSCHLVMELVPYSSLKHYMRKRNTFKFTEERTRNVIHTILKAVHYLHTKRICHRDIKPDNILYNWQNEQLKLIDLGIARQIPHRPMCTVTGSLFYKAPQMFSGVYGQQVDLWAVGVIVYQIIASELPFVDEYTSQTINKICSDQPDLTKLVSVSSLAKDFVRRLLTKNASKRLSAKEALRHPWMLADLQSQSLTMLLAQSSKQLQTAQQSVESERLSPEIGVIEDYYFERMRGRCDSLPSIILDSTYKDLV